MYAQTSTWMMIGELFKGLGYVLSGVVIIEITVGIIPGWILGKIMDWWDDKAPN